MGACEPGQGRKSAAISSHLQVRWASHRTADEHRLRPDCQSSASTADAHPDPRPEPLRRRPGRGQYVVVARRYRPQTFDELIGQEHVAQALSNAIATNRVGHAYLFTGARGVGKTSAARILAKALNCEHGPTPSPCNQCDICQSISRGDDVDVLEIDGASNRGIDEIRQLRQNVSVRPSRSRFKIYIIDEVHMLTREAFNALLKTLEEPPEHVKFIFCTTEATKIPITILSRCQRFDFAGILDRGRSPSGCGRSWRPKGSRPSPRRWSARPAGGRLDARQPVAAGATAGLRRRAGSRWPTCTACWARPATSGWRRWSSTWSSATRPPPWPIWTPRSAKASTSANCSSNSSATSATAWRPRSAARADAFLYTSAAGAEQVAEAGKRLGLETVLAAMQILDQTLSRMRYSTQGRILAELALVRICQLEDSGRTGRR